MLKLCDTHQIVYDTAKWLYCPVCEDYKEIDRHERENERLRIALETALKHTPSALIATPDMWDWMTANEQIDAFAVWHNSHCKPTPHADIFCGTQHIERDAWLAACKWASKMPRARNR